ncbi:MAG: hypothetical protein CMG17_00560 [Candidatus Marinimicrobia bacterium]|nr:hypothetical protein [Candidatus Neomarinimicrobiota bacterium]|tara:strand:- start:4726 stop:4974 length:249 start_codon:yes stop_codon:yes gene_type:complete
MLVEGLGNITFVNGLLRIQALTVNTDGKLSESGTIEIPGNRVGEIINALSAGATGISEKLGEAQTPNNDEKPKKESNKKKKK